MASNLPANLPSIARAKLPAVYSHAKEALARCDQIDECKDWADKAEALASYAKQAQDDQLRKTADRIQARAIRRCGQLLQEIEKASGARTDREPKSGEGPRLTRKGAAHDAGLSHRQQRTALRVARIGDEEFEDAVESDDPPTVTALAERGKVPSVAHLEGRKPENFSVATTALGWIRDLSEFCDKHTPRFAVEGITPSELRKNGRRIQGQIKRISAWLTAAADLIEKEKE